MNIVLYGHGGSRNHGCEAIVRSTILLLGKEHHYTLLSERPEEDAEYGLDSIATIIPSRNSLPVGVRRLLYLIEMKICRSERVYYRRIYQSFIKRIGPCDLAVAIGGDNYCYDGMFEQFSVMNYRFRKKGIRTCLWGCSIDAERLDKHLIDDLRGFSFIYAREQLTYQALLLAGIKNVVHLPDPAFCLSVLQPLDFQYPSDIDYVGINISPLVINQETISGVIINSFLRLIDFIIEKTEFGVLLLPHVVWSSNDDRGPLSILYQSYAGTGRVFMIGDCDCMKLKGHISKCRYLVAARTHASIAGYSLLIPTLVVGYSVKSRGIARDIFGYDDPYVLPVQDIKDPEDLRNRFIWLLENEKPIIDHLRSIIPQYTRSISKIIELI